jgi:hypothetical protein
VVEQQPQSAVGEVPESASGVFDLQVEVLGRSVAHGGWSKCAHSSARHPGITILQAASPPGVVDRGEPEQPGNQVHGEHDRRPDRTTRSRLRPPATNPSVGIDQPVAGRDSPSSPAPQEITRNPPQCRTHDFAGTLTQPPAVTCHEHQHRDRIGCGHDQPTNAVTSRRQNHRL